MRPINRSLVATCLGLSFVVIGAGSSGATAVSAPESRSIVPVSECNGDPGFDPSLDPVHCHYQHTGATPTHPLPDPRGDAERRHHDDRSL